MQNKRKILTYDIETALYKFYGFSLGEQTVRHTQLVPGWSRPRIICLCYKWSDEKAVHTLDWDYEKQDSVKIIEEFDKLTEQADVVIGKNSARFDNKYVNTIRMFAGLDGCPDWIKYTDDLEKQLRKYFYLPSYSLDYISNELGLGGKNPMEFQDWVHICEKTTDLGIKAFNKMIKYCKKDVVDTETIWKYCEKHFEPKLNANTLFFKNTGKKSTAHRCTNCGSVNCAKNGTRASGKTVYQRYFCNDHGGYAGREPIRIKQ